jgi:hypothetical protein
MFVTEPELLTLDFSFNCVNLAFTQPELLVLTFFVTCNMVQYSKNYRIFYTKKCHKALKNMGLGSGIRDTRYGIRKKTIPDPGSGSATLLTNPELGILTYPLTLAKPVL